MRFNSIIDIRAIARKPRPIRIEAAQSMSSDSSQSNVCDRGTISRNSDASRFEKYCSVLEILTFSRRH